jgi:hypothetical protein
MIHGPRVNRGENHGVHVQVLNRFGPADGKAEEFLFAINGPAVEKSYDLVIRRQLGECSGCRRRRVSIARRRVS